MSSPLNYTPRRRMNDPAQSRSLARDDVTYADEADRQAREIDRQRNPPAWAVPGGPLSAPYDPTSFDKVFHPERVSAPLDRPATIARPVTGSPVSIGPVAKAVQSVANTTAVTATGTPQPELGSGDVRRIETQYAPRDSNGALAPVTGTVRNLPASAPGFINGVQTDGAPVTGVVQGGTHAKERIAQYGNGGAPVASTVAASLTATPAPTSGPMDLPSGIKPFNTAVADAKPEQQVFGKPLSATSDLSRIGNVYPTAEDRAGAAVGNVVRTANDVVSPGVPADSRVAYQPPNPSDRVFDVPQFIRGAFGTPPATAPTTPRAPLPATPASTVPEANPRPNSIASFGSVPAVVPPSQDDELRRRQVASNQ